MWTAYCIIVMAIYWIFECVPLAITALIPVVLLPLTGNILLQIY
jgi:sodium-dependent dicarboxylate transporter 2/3/5